jgi:hypothetical protein
VGKGKALCRGRYTPNLNYALIVGTISDWWCKADPSVTCLTVSLTMSDVFTTQAHWGNQVFDWAKTVSLGEKPGFWLSSYQM